MKKLILLLLLSLCFIGCEKPTPCDNTPRSIGGPGSVVYGGRDDYQGARGCKNRKAFVKMMYQCSSECNMAFEERVERFRKTYIKTREIVDWRNAGGRANNGRVYIIYCAYETVRK